MAARFLSIIPCSEISYVISVWQVISIAFSVLYV